MYITDTEMEGTSTVMDIRGYGSVKIKTKNILVYSNFYFIPYLSSTYIYIFQLEHILKTLCIIAQ